MKPGDIKNMTTEEIKQSVISMKEKLFDLRVECTSGRIERPHKFREIRKDIARCLTILKEKQGEGKQG